MAQQQNNFALQTPDYYFCMDANKIIDQLGGTGAVAKICGVSGTCRLAVATNGIPRPWIRFSWHAIATKVDWDQVLTPEERQA